MNKNITIIGHFGYYNNQLDGQTVKTRTIYQSLKCYGLNINYIDVSYGITIKTIIKIITSLLISNIYIVLPGKNQLKFWTKIITPLKYFFRKKVHYIVVGGWLPEAIKKNEFAINKLKQFESINCETNSIVNKLYELNLKSNILLNYRNDSGYIKSFHSVKNNCIKFYFFSRIIREKGIFKAIDFFIKFNNENPNSELLIYGPILLKKDEKYKFENLLSKKIKYKGILNPSDISKTLSNLDVLLFPTFYEGEGFPGVIVDAKLSGTTVIASNWKYNSEIIKHKKDGYILDFDNSSEVSNAIEYYSNIKNINQLKENSHKSAEKYIESNVMSAWITKNL